jgi:hypothetical protein
MKSSSELKPDTSDIELPPPAAYIREWEGDDSDAGVLLAVLTEDECDGTGWKAVYTAEQFRTALSAAVRPSGSTATFGALKAKTAECNKLQTALELACSYLTDEQVDEIAAAMPT